MFIQQEYVSMSPARFYPNEDKMKVPTPWGSAYFNHAQLQDETNYWGVKAWVTPNPHTSMAYVPIHNKAYLSTPMLRSEPQYKMYH